MEITPTSRWGDPAKNPSKNHHLHGSSAYWDGSNGPMLFTWGENESAKLAAQPNGIGGMPGGMLTASSRGSNPNTAIVCALAPIDGDANHDVVEGIARAYDATNLDPTPIDPLTPKLKLIWDSKRAGVTFNYSKFCTPVVADGKFFVPTYDGRVDVYILNPSYSYLAIATLYSSELSNVRNSPQSRWDHSPRMKPR